MSTLYVVATPIGNLEDVTHRAVRILSEVDALACEDTRRTRAILERYGVPRPGLVFPYHEHNEREAAGRVMGLLEKGSRVALCTNAGYPGISDPGYRAVSEAHDRGFRVEVVPGAGAVEAALAVSGLSAASFTFKGFPPKKPGKRRSFLEADRASPHTLVFFESPERVGGFLAAALEVLGDRTAAVCVELTKKFEEVSRGYLSDLAARFASEKVRGEVTVVVAGDNPKFVRERGTATASAAESAEDAENG